jgi:Flp pilus assembly secretin CpaC
MTMTATAALLAMVVPVWASSPGVAGAANADNALASDIPAAAYSPVGDYTVAAACSAAADYTTAAVAVELPMERPVHVQVTARVVVVDREEAARVGLGYVVLGNDRVRVGDGGNAGGGTDAGRGGGTGWGRGVGPGGSGGVGVEVLGATAFLDLVRHRRLVQSESTQQVLVLSGGEARVASSEVSLGRHMARSRGPSLTVVPTVEADGRVHLWVRAGLDDVVRYGWGYEADGSPASVDTEIVARPGEELILASGTVTESTSERGLLRWGGATRDRDVLIVLRVEVGR